MKKVPSIIEQGKRALNDIEQYKKGKLTFKTYKLEVPNETLETEDVKHIREDVLRVSQKVLAESIGVSVRTVQGWEIGKSKPIGAARRLLHLMADVPEIRKVVLSHR
jgi:putative transcriptional regulator